MRHTEETKQKLRELAVGRTMSASARLKMSLSGGGWKGKKRGVETKRKMSLAKLGKYNGDRNPNWRGGKAKPLHSQRTNTAFKRWKESVFRRDNWLCQKYLIQTDDLVAHHVFNFLSHPELRFQIDNGITLSRKAHLEFHSKYGNRDNNRQQITEFLSC